MENEIEKIVIQDRNIYETLKNKWNNSGFQKYFKNMGWSFASKTISLLMSFFIGILVARYLGPERYGTLNYVISFITIFSFLASFGVDNILVREFVNQKNDIQKQNILNTALILKFISSTIIIWIAVLISKFIGNENYITSLILIYSIQLIFSSFSVIDFFFQSELKYKYSFWAQFISTIGVSLLRIYLIYTNLGTGWFILSLVFETILSSFILLKIYQKKYGTISIKFNLNIAKNLLSNSWPFIFTAAFYLIYSKIDQIMIGNMLSNYSLGIYSTGVKLAEIWYFIPTIIIGVTTPALIRAKNNSLLYNKRLKYLLVLILIIALSVALFEFIFAKYLILFMFGKEYIESIIILKIYTWAGIMISIILYANNYLMIENKTKIIMFSSFTGAVLNIFLNYIFIPKFGITGSAWATLISYSIVPFIIYISNKNLILRSENTNSIN